MLILINMAFYYLSRFYYLSYMKKLWCIQLISYIKFKGGDIMSGAHYDMHKRNGYSSDEPYPEIKVL